MTVIACRPRPLLAVLAATCLLTAACTGSDPTGPDDAPVDAPMVVESCEGPLPVGAREPVTCTAAFAHDPATTGDAQVLSVSYLGEGGLLVALDLGGADADG